MEPWQLGVVEAATAIRSGQLSGAELVGSLLGRIDALDGDLQAWVTVDRDPPPSDPPGGPLAGVPLGVKDVIDAAGLPTTASSRVLAGAPPAGTDATCVAGLRSAGATILGKLHTAEFACADPPPTRNPWNVEHTPGGSSSGSGVAVAAGMVPAALGTQTGGSTLRPAVYNGVVGYKATYGAVSNDGVIAVSWSLDHVGVIARSVADAAAVMAAAGSDLVGRPGLLEPRRPAVVGLVTSFFLERCEPEMRAVTLDVAARLEAAGCEVREIRLPDSFDRIAPCHATIMRAEMYASHRERWNQWRELYGPKNAALLEEGSRLPAADYVLARRQHPELAAELEAAIGQVDVALTPGTPSAAPRDTTNTGDASFQSPWTFAGLPAVALPVAVNPWGIPLGVQLVGRRWRDAELLAQAGWCESVLEFAARPPCWTGERRSPVSAGL